MCTCLFPLLRYIALSRYPSETDVDYISVPNQEEQTVKVCSSQLLPGQYHVGVQNFGYSYVNFTLRSDIVSMLAALSFLVVRQTVFVPSIDPSQHNFSMAVLCPLSRRLSLLVSPKVLSPGSLTNCLL